MFSCLAEAILSMEQSKREVELRIKARAQGLPQLDPALATGTGVAVPARLRVPRLRVQGRTIYTSGSRSSKE